MPRTNKEHKETRYHVALRPATLAVPMRFLSPSIRYRNLLF